MYVLGRFQDFFYTWMAMILMGVRMKDTEVYPAPTV